MLRIQNQEPQHFERPSRRPSIREFSVRDELILVAPQHSSDSPDSSEPNRALTLNGSGREIWELCDGSRSVDDMIQLLEARYAVDRDVLLWQVRETLSKMSRLGFVDSFHSQPTSEAATTIVIGVEDKPYFWWQTAIFLESFSGKLPAGWKTLVVVCNSGAPISENLKAILTRYDTMFAEGENRADRDPLDIGRNGGECYSALNRIEALSVASEHVRDDDVICLLDSDIFLYGPLNEDIMPTGCAAPKNWHIGSRPFFSSVDDNKGAGVDLDKLLEAIGCDQDFMPGGVNVFVTGKVAKSKKYIADCFRFAHVLFLLGRTAGADNVWMAEMPCFTLAMTANGVSYDLLEQKELLVSDSDEPSIPAGTLYHYYCDPTAFRDSKWHKQSYVEQDFLRTDFEQFALDATTDHEKYFFQLAERARRRLYS